MPIEQFHCNSCRDHIEASFQAKAIEKIPRRNWLCEQSLKKHLVEKSDFDFFLEDKY